MADLYFHVWVTVTSLTIIILVAAYILHDQIARRYEKIDNEQERLTRLAKLNSLTRTILGVLAMAGGSFWLYYIQTHEIYITKSLRGTHDIIPPILMALIGLILLGLGIKKRLSLRA